MDFDYTVVPALIFLIAILVLWISIRHLRSLSTKSYRTWRKVAERIALSVVVLVAVVVAGSSSYNAIALHHFRANNPLPGSFYTVNGHRMHINCAGSGSPTIVLESGLGNDALIWGGVQPVLAKTTRVCSYDRAGFGRSEALPAPRDADHIASELHELLRQANVNGSIVLMGHSIAGIYMRDYASRYTADIAGIVFVDGSTPLQDENPAMKAMTGNVPQQWLYTVMRTAWSAGLPRLMGLCSRPITGFDAQTGKLEAEEQCHTPFGAISAEFASINQSGRETVHTGPYGALPILIFSEDGAIMAHGPNPPQRIANFVKMWEQMQEDLKKLSTRSRRIIAKNSPHYIQLVRADLIEREVPLFIEQIRGTAPQPTNYGSTVTE